MQILEKNLSELKPYEKNPRRNDEAVQYVANSIKEFGWKQPIVIDKDNVIIAGHTRFKAAKELGIEKVPCVIADDLTPEQIKAYRIADNKTNDKATWDDEVLGEELEDLNGLFDMTDFGFSDFEISLFTGGLESNFSGPAEPSDKTSYHYSEQYGVIVVCQDEAEQEEVYNRLVSEGFECKVVAV